MRYTETLVETRAFSRFGLVFYEQALLTHKAYSMFLFNQSYGDQRLQYAQCTRVKQRFEQKHCTVAAVLKLVSGKQIKFWKK